MGKLKLSKLFVLIQNYSLMYLPNERKLSSNTIRSYRYTLVSLLEFAKNKYQIPLYELTFEKISKVTVLEYLQNLDLKGCTAHTRNQRLYAIQNFFKYAAREELEAIIYWDEIKMIQTAKTHETVIGYLSEDAMQKVLEQPDFTTHKGLRDFYIMFLMYKLGCRVEELSNIRLFDLNLCKSPYITLHGKGQKDRNLPLRDTIVTHTLKYLKLFHPNCSINSSDFLIYTYRNGEKKRMTEDNIRKIVKKYGLMAKKECAEVPENLHPHIFRHTFAMHAYKNGMPLEILKDWLGHADYSSTHIYAKADTEMKRKAIENAFPEESPLMPYINSDYYIVDDETLIKKLCGLI